VKGTCREPCGAARTVAVIPAMRDPLTDRASDGGAENGRQAGSPPILSLYKSPAPRFANSPSRRWNSATPLAN
jgi:hypothetical protein